MATMILEVYCGHMTVYKSQLTVYKSQLAIGDLGGAVDDGAE